MDRAKAIKRINNLQKIKGIIEIAKFDTLQKLAEADRVKKYHYEIAETSKQVIAYAKSKFHLSNKLMDNVFKKNFAGNKLFVYITIPSDLLAISYDRIETILDKEFNKSKDKIITIGDPALKYAKKRKLSNVSHFGTLEEELVSLVSAIVNLLNSNQVDEVRVIANTSSIREESYSIFPISPDSTKKDVYKKMNKTKFYYSLSEIIESILTSYFENIFEGIYKEAYREFYKEKLVRHESSITTTDEKIKELKMELHKVRRKKETEEMIAVSQIAKRR